MPSQWALQYFDPSGGIQLQAGFAHFFAFAISPPSSGVFTWEAQLLSVPN